MLSNRYDAFYQASPGAPFIETELKGWPRNRSEAILMDAPPGGAVLDIGCGNGQLLYSLRARYSRIIGLEFSPSRLQEASRNLEAHGFHGVLGSAEDMNEVESGSIDCVVSADTIEHIPDVYAAVDEVFRVLKRGGMFVVNTPNVAFLKKRLLLLLGRFPSTSQPNEGLGSDILFDGGHFHYFTFRSLRLVLERSGFEVVARRGYGRLGKIHDIYPQLLSGGLQLVARKPA